jgi:iron complex outermembrane receptor protein
MNHRSTLHCGAALLVCAMAASQAAAQAAPADAAAQSQATDTAASQAAAQAAPAAPAAQSQTNNEIVITARRREESLQNVPIAVQAFSQDQLRANSVSSSNDLQTVVPGLTVAAGSGNPGLPRFAIRGRGLNYGAAAGAVETYFAEVPLSAPFQEPTLPPQFFDLQSLQILKGPQGTLFGRSTTGGAVLVVPAAPTDQFEGYVRLQGGNFNNIQAEGAINVPIAGDRAALRVAGFYWRRAGYSRTFGGNIAENTGPGTGLPAVILPAQRYNNQNVQEFRATLLLRPSEQLTNSTIVTFHRDRNVSSAGAGLFANVFGAPGLPFNAVTPAPGYRTQRSFSDLLLGGNPPNKIWAIINTTSYEVTPNLTLKNIFGYIDSSGTVGSGTNADGSTRNTINLYAYPRPQLNHQTTNEVQLQGHNFDGRLEWILGGLLDRTREPKGPNTTNFGSLRGRVGGWNSIFVANDVTSYALFGSATFKLTDQFSATAGYRHAWNHIEQLLATATANLPLPAPTSYTPGTEARFSTRQPGDTYNFGLEYHPNHDLMLYGGYRRGFKYGGFNAIVVGANSPLATFRPETIDDFYAGVKTRFNIGGMPGHFNIEGYWDLYHGQQTSYLSLAGAQLATVTANVPETTYRGIDLDVAISPTPWLELSGNYSYTDGYIREYIDQSCVATNCGVPSQNLDLSVNPVPYVSPNKFVLSARFHGELPGQKGEIVFTPTVTYQDTFYGPFARLGPQASAVLFGQNFDQIAHGGDLTPGYTLLNIHTEWNRILGSNIDAALTVTNVFNKNFQIGNSTTLNFGVEGIAYGPPRMVTFELRARF